MKMPDCGFIKADCVAPNIYKVSCKSMIDGKITKFFLNEDQIIRMNKWLQGEGLIQNMLHDLTVEKRELLMTGVTPEQWDNMFSEEE